MREGGGIRRQPMVAQPLCEMHGSRIFRDSDRCIFIEIKVLRRDNVLFYLAQAVCWRDVSNDRCCWKCINDGKCWWSVNWWWWQHRRKVSFDTGIDYFIKLYSENSESLENLLLWAVRPNADRCQVVARNVVQNCTIVAALIFVLFWDRTLLNPFTVLLVFAISTFQLENLEPTTLRVVSVKVDSLRNSPWSDKQRHEEALRRLRSLIPNRFQFGCGRGHPSHRRASWVWTP